MRFDAYGLATRVAIDEERAIRNCRFQRDQAPEVQHVADQIAEAHRIRRQRGEFFDLPVAGQHAAVLVDAYEMFEVTRTRDDAGSI